MFIYLFLNERLAVWFRLALDYVALEALNLQRVFLHARVTGICHHAQFKVLKNEKRARETKRIPMVVFIGYCFILNEITKVLGIKTSRLFTQQMSTLLLYLTSVSEPPPMGIIFILQKEI